MNAVKHIEMILARDLGGTKILAALINGQTVLERVEALTDRDSGPDAWLAQPTTCHP